MSRKVYEKDKWPIDTNHGWLLRATINEKGSLYGLCLTIKTKINNIMIEQNFFIKNQRSYLVIFGQPYTIASRMEIKVMDDGYIMFGYKVMMEKD